MSSSICMMIEPGDQIEAIFINCNQISSMLKHIRAIRHIFLLSVACCMFTACSLDPDPQDQYPEPIRSYFILYNYLSTPYDLLWEVEGYTLSALHTYGGTILGYVILDSIADDITFIVKEPNRGKMLQTGNFRLEENNYHMLAVMGKDTAAQIVFDPMDLDPPASGMLKFRFIQTAPEYGPLDIYFGGLTEDQKMISGLEYREVSGYVEATLGELRDSVIVTTHNSPVTDSILVSYTGVSAVHPDRIYLGVIGHPDPSDSVSLDLVFYDQPVAY